MDLMKLPAILLRWRWVIISVVIVTGVALALQLRSATVTYHSGVRVQITAPQDADVSLIDSGNPSSSTLRDDLTLVQNDFVAVVGSDEVRRRTIQQLQLNGRDAAYSVSASTVLDSNFVDVTVSMRSATFARAVADAHSAQALRYYGELRAKPATETAHLLAAQLQGARDAVTAADGSEGDQAGAAQAQEARATYQLLLRKYALATLAAENASRVTYIQVVEPATTPSRPGLAQKLRSFGVLAVVGSLGFSILLAVLLESLFPRRGADQPPSVRHAGGEDGGAERRARARMRRRAPAHYASHYLNGTAAGRGTAAVGDSPTGGEGDG